LFTLDGFWNITEVPSINFWASFFHSKGNTLTLTKKYWVILEQTYLVTLVVASSLPMIILDALVKNLSEIVVHTC
jgi:ligand-binding SRPBCC domain-containing protein